MLTLVRQESHTISALHLSATLSRQTNLDTKKNELYCKSAQNVSLVIHDRQVLT